LKHLQIKENQYLITSYYPNKSYSFSKEEKLPEKVIKGIMIQIIKVYYKFKLKSNIFLNIISFNVLI
jgi:hypothetical protein